MFSKNAIFNLSSMKKILKTCTYFLIVINLFIPSSYGMAALNANVIISEVFKPKWEIGDWWKVKLSCKALERPMPYWEHYILRFEMIGKEKIRDIEESEEKGKISYKGYKGCYIIKVIVEDLSDFPYIYMLFFDENNYNLRRVRKLEKGSNTVTNEYNFKPGAVLFKDTFLLVDFPMFTEEEKKSFKQQGEKNIIQTIKSKNILIKGKYVTCKEITLILPSKFPHEKEYISIQRWIPYMPWWVSLVTNREDGLKAELIEYGHKGEKKKDKIEINNCAE